MQIVDVDFVQRGAEAKFIGGSVDVTMLHPGTEEHSGEAPGIVIATDAFFTHGHAAKLTAPDDECVI